MVWCSPAPRQRLESSGHLTAAPFHRLRSALRSGGSVRLGPKVTIVDVFATVLVLGSSSIVRLAEKPQILRRCITAASVGSQVIGLEPGAGFAPGAVGALPGAAQAVSLGDESAGGTGY